LTYAPVIHAGTVRVLSQKMATLATAQQVTLERTVTKVTLKKNLYLSMQFLHLKYVLQIHLSFGKGWFSIAEFK